VDVVFARGFAGLSDRLAALGTQRVLVLATPSRRFVAELVAELASFSPAVFDGARVHVPAEVVEAAALVLAESGADTVVALGGGSPIGLAKALRLRTGVRFAALPTTYAGSEMTTMYGVTTGATKQTGRDPRVRPDLIWYDVALTYDMPLALSVQSLCNAVAHVASVMSTSSLDEAARADGIDALSTTLGAIAGLVPDPARPDREVATQPRRTADELAAARELAQRGASACAAVYERGKPGVQHALAHLLGGALRLEHAALHAVLLPHFIAYVRSTQPKLVAELEALIGAVPLDLFVLRALERAGAPTTLAELGAAPDAIAAALATRPDLPALGLI
jgi:maleylacetate reductase